jgi:hypothetical protein
LSDRHFTAIILTLYFISISELPLRYLGEVIINLLEVRGLFRPVPYLAFPLYHNSISGNGTETRDTISAGDSISYTVLFKRI